MTDRRTKEAIRYLGYRHNAVDDRTLTLINMSFEELDKCAQKKAVYRIFECNIKDENELHIGTINIKSRNLAKNLEGCEDVILFAATLGTEVDRILKKYSITNVAKAVVFQACAAAYLEAYCDRIQQELAEQFEQEEKWLRPRFSPGYGDFDICHQEEILRILDTSKKIGLSRTENNMLIPTKSVTAFIGISKKKTDCHHSGCDTCEKADCAYRRNERRQHEY